MTGRSHSKERLRRRQPIPTQTFFNLPEAKRRALIAIAIDEFAEHDFQNASISRIVAKAGIAKGSLYQYFADKEDLYLYLIDLAGQEKRKFLSGQKPPSPDMGLFPYLKWLLETGTHFRFAHPKLEQVVARALAPGQGLRTDLGKRLKEQTEAYWRQLVQMGVERGDVDPGYDTGLVAWVFTVLTSELGWYALSRLGTESPDDPHLADRYNREAAPLFTELIRMLEHGLRPR